MARTYYKEATKIEIIAKKGLVTPRQKSAEELLIDRLLPLLRGGSVMLAVTDPNQTYRPRIGTPLLVIAPVPSSAEHLLIALQGGKCELVEASQIQAASFVKIGLKLLAATKIAAAIKAIYGH